MDDACFDQLTRSLAISRRGLLRGIAVSVGGGLLAVVGLGETAAQSCRAAGRTCREDANCCAPTTCKPNTTGRNVCTCPAGTAPCHGACLDPTTAYLSDQDNCGICGRRCPHVHNSVPICQSGQCGFVCNAGFIPCAGACIPVCTALDQCHLAGVCDPTTGQCTNPTLPDGTGCDDGNACTSGDTSLNGVCGGGTPADFSVTCV